MKEQYVGDANDFGKYALLRALSGGGRTTIGVAWMLTPADERNDGKRLSYLGVPANRSHDPELFDLMRAVGEAADGTRLKLLEKSGVIPGALFFDPGISDLLLERREYFRSMHVALATADLIFFDPDNGLDVPSRGKGAKGSSKYVFRDEVEAAHAAGKSVLMYQHFPREERAGIVQRVATELHQLCGAAQVWAFLTPHVVFLLVLESRHLATIGADAAVAATRWPVSFIRGHRIV